MIEGFDTEAGRFKNSVLMDKEVFNQLKSCD